MKQLRIIGLSMLAVLALGVVVVSSASAAQGLPTAEPTSKENTTDAINIGEPEYLLTNKNKINCASATGTSTETGSPAASGEFHITFKGCVGTVSGIKAKCTGLGDTTEGEILSLGTYQTVYDTGGTELGVALLFTVSSTHFTCAGLFLQVTKGTQLCLIKEPYISKTLHETVCLQSEGKQSEMYLNDAAETLTPKLVVEEGEKNLPEAAENAKALILNLSTSVNQLTHYKMN